MLFDEFLDFQPNLGVVPLKQAAAAYSATVAELANFEPIRTAATFGGLLTRPQLQAIVFG
jgi:hypothetical protein